MGASHARLFKEGCLVLSEDTRVFGVVVRGHQVPLLHMPTHIITLVEEWDRSCRLFIMRRFGTLMVKYASHASSRLICLVSILPA